MSITIDGDTIESVIIAGPPGPPGPAGDDGADGPPGADGPAGPAGTGIELAGALNDPSELPPSGAPGEAYLIDGYVWVWTVDQFVNAGPLQGPPGADGADGADGAPGADGADGADGSDGAPGTPGAAGASAYQIAVSNGFVGNEAAWLASLQGADGADGENGAPGADGADGDDGDAGPPGQSAYAVAVSNGFVGNEAAWLASLQGADGADGAPGADGEPGLDGDDGAPGADGADGATGLSAYQVAVNNGFVGNEAAWLASLQGADGADGTNGADGEPGADGDQGPPGPNTGLTVVSFAGEFDNGDSGSAKTIDFATGNKQKVVLTADTTLTITGLDEVAHVQLRIIENGAGDHNITFVGLNAARWLGAVAQPDHNRAAGGETILSIFFDGTNAIQSMLKVGAQ